MTDSGTPYIVIVTEQRGGFKGSDEWTSCYHVVTDTPERAKQLVVEDGLDFDLKPEDIGDVDYPDNCPVVQTHSDSHAIVHLSVTELPVLAQNEIPPETVIPVGELNHHNNDYAALTDSSEPPSVIKGPDAALVKGGTVYVPAPGIDMGDLDD